MGAAFMNKVSHNYYFLSFLLFFPSCSGANLEGITTCELCKEKLRLNIDNFDIQELYRTHVQVSYFTSLGGQKSQFPNPKALIKMNKEAVFIYCDFFN